MEWPDASKKYPLPCHSTVQAEDRFSILDRDELHVPLWDLLEALLSQTIHSPTQLIDILETIAVCRTGSSLTDYGSLRQHLEEHADLSFYSLTWPAISKIALEMPNLFPDHTLQILTPEHPAIYLSRQQTACLVVHQFLCTLTAPSWQDGYQDFHIWYAAEQPHPGAVTAYLTALFTFLTRLPSLQSPHSITYTLHTHLPNPTSDPPFPRPLCNLQVLYRPSQSTSPSLLGLSGGASVISANKYIGFGRTGTQEEVHVGCTPEACPTVLFTPPLGVYQALVTRGCEAMVVVEGYGREARLERVLRRGEVEGWDGRTMLFADAAELDLVDHERLARQDGKKGLPDLLPGMVEREVNKLLVAFASAPGEERYKEVYTGFWGCRTFGGNAGIKACIQWCATSAAGVETLNFICNGEDQVGFGRELEHFVGQLKQLGTTSADLLKLLLSLTIQDCSREESSLEVLLGHLGGSSRSLE